MHYILAMVYKDYDLTGILVKDDWQREAQKTNEELSDKIMNSDYFTKYTQITILINNHY